LSETTQSSNTDLKELNVKCLCDNDMIFCYVFSALKTASLVPKRIIAKELLARIY